MFIYILLKTCILTLMIFSLHSSSSPFFPLFPCIFLFPFLSFNPSLRCPCPTISFPSTPHIHASVLNSVRGGEVHHIFACLPTEDIHSFLEQRARQRLFYSLKYIQETSPVATCSERERKKKNRNHVKTTVTNANNNNMLFVTLHGFFIIFPYFEEKLPPETAAGSAGSKAVMTFLTALRLNPKGILWSRYRPVANRDLCASELYGGQPRVGVKERQSGLFRFLCFPFAFFFCSLFIRCLLSVMSNWEPCFPPRPSAPEAGERFHRRPPSSLRLRMN